MNKLSFLNDLKRKKKIELVRSSEEIKESYIKKSESSLVSSKILLENDKLEESTALSYYSMYHLLTALFFKTGIKCENHTASIILMKEIFELENKELLLAKKERVDKQYYTNFIITKGEVKEFIKEAEKFNAWLLDFISKVSNTKITLFRNKFQDIFK